MRDYNDREGVDKEVGGQLDYEPDWVTVTYDLMVSCLGHKK